MAWTVDWNGPCSSVRAMVSLADALQQRVQAFAVRAIRFVESLPKTAAADVIGRQLIRASTGAASNYRGARRARSRAEFIAKLGIVLEEADETEHWLETVRDQPLAAGPELDWLLGEAAELRAIFAQSLRTARRHHRSVNSSNPTSSDH